MIRKSQILLVVLVITAAINSNAQKLVIGAFAGPNMNFIKIKSNYFLYDNIKMNPCLSFTTGCYLETSGQVFGAMISGEYQRTKAKDNVEFIATDVYGTVIGGFEKSIINQEFVISTIGTFQATKKLYLGLGLSTAVLLESNMKFKEKISINGENMLQANTNYQYKLFTFSVPLLIGLNLNRVDLFVRFNKGISNKIIFKNSFFKEYDGVLLLGLGYKFYQKKIE